MPVRWRPQPPSHCALTPTTGSSRESRPPHCIEAAALQKAADDLAQASKTLAGASADGPLATQRDQLLAQVRAAQDAVLKAQDASTDSAEDAAARERSERRLRVLGEHLNAASERLEGTQ